jgi:hypothetical protein
MKRDPACRKKIASCPSCDYESPFEKNLLMHFSRKPQCSKANFAKSNPDQVIPPRQIIQKYQDIRDNKKSNPMKTFISSHLLNNMETTFDGTATNTSPHTTNESSTDIMMTIEHQKRSHRDSTFSDTREATRLLGKNINYPASALTGPHAMITKDKAVAHDQPVTSQKKPNSSSPAYVSLLQPLDDTSDIASSSIINVDIDDVHFDESADYYEDDELANDQWEHFPVTNTITADQAHVTDVCREDLGLGFKNLNLVPIDITNQLSKTRENDRSLVLLDNYELPIVELLIIMKHSSISVIDEVIAWYYRNKESEGMTSTNFGNSRGYKHQKKIGSRATFLKHLQKIVYGSKENFSRIQHDLTLLPLTYNIIVPMTRFSFQDYIADLITDRSIWHADNVWFDPEDPYNIPGSESDYGDLNTGVWWERAVGLCNRELNEVVLNYILFIDGLKIDNNGKIECEAVLCCCGWLKREARNRSSSWFILGFLEDIGRLKKGDAGNYTPGMKIVDYHMMLDHILDEMKMINRHGGIKLSIPKLTGAGFVDVIARPQLQFVIGDCKGNNMLTGRYASHGIQVKHLCRDCVVPTKLANESAGRCTFRSNFNMQNMSFQNLRLNSFHNLEKNSFWDLPFGGNPGGIYLSTPIEVLHGINLGHCAYIHSSMEYRFPPTFHNKMRPWAKIVSLMGRRQSLRGFPDLRPFRNGLLNQSSLTGDEKVGRVFILFLMFMQSEFILDALHPRNTYPYFSVREDEDVDEERKAEKVQITLHDLRAHLMMFEKTLCMHAWLKSDTLPRNDLIETEGNGGYSPADAAFRSYMDLMNENIYLKGGVGTNTTKFHQLKHFTKYISEFGVPQNFDGGILEHHGKEMVKDLAQRTNKKFSTISQDIATRFVEERMFEKAISTHLMNFPNDSDRLRKFCRNHDLFPNSLRGETPEPISTAPQARGAKFIIKREFLDPEHPGVFDRVANRWIIEQRLTFEWKGKKNDLPAHLNAFPEEVTVALGDRLFNHHASYGGRLGDNVSEIHGFCEYRDNEGNIFRSDPQFYKEGEWFDWAFFNWEGLLEPIVGRILIMIDLRNSEIEYEEPGDDNTSDAEPPIHFLTNDLWCLVRAGASSIQPSGVHPLTDNHFDSSIAYRVKLEKEYRLVPFSALVGPAFVIENFPTEGNQELLNVSRRDGIKLNPYDGTVIVVKPVTAWARAFIP